MDAARPQLGPLSPWVDWNAAKAMNNGDLPKGWWSPPSVPASIKAALPMAIESHERALQPAAPDFITAHLARLSVHYPVNRTQQEWEIIFEDFMADLDDVPADILVEVIRRHRQASRFFPCVAELRSAATQLITDRKTMIWRMYKLAKLETDEEAAERLKCEAEEAAAQDRRYLEQNPDAAIFRRYFKTIPGISAITWLPWLKSAVKAHGLEVVDAWHKDIEGTNAGDPLERLREKERHHLAACDIGIGLPGVSAAEAASGVRDACLTAHSAHRKKAGEADGRPDLPPDQSGN